MKSNGVNYMIKKWNFIPEEKRIKKRELVHELPSEPLISIIIPNYNYGEYIGDALDSCLNQTYPRIEIIVVDDASTDNSIEIIESYLPKVTLVRNKKNLGCSASINIGAKLAKGSIIQELDSDDMLKPDYCLEIARAMTEHNVAIAYTDIIVMKNHMTRIYRQGEYSYKELLRRDYMYGCAIRRDVFEAVGGFNESLNHAESYDLRKRICSRYNSAYYIRKPLFIRRYHGRNKHLESAKR